MQKLVCSSLPRIKPRLYLLLSCRLQLHLLARRTAQRLSALLIRHDPDSQINCDTTLPLSLRITCGNDTLFVASPFRHEAVDNRTRKAMTEVHAPQRCQGRPRSKAMREESLQARRAETLTVCRCVSQGAQPLEIVRKAPGTPLQQSDVHRGGKQRRLLGGLPGLLGGCKPEL